MSESRPAGPPFADCVVCERPIQEAHNAVIAGESHPTETDVGQVHYRHTYHDAAEVEL